MTLIYNEDSNTSPVNDLSNNSFMLALADYTGAAIPREGIYSFQVTYVNFTVVQVNGTGVVKPIRTPIVLEKCDINKHFLQYGEMFTQLQVDKGFCVPPGKYNNSIIGRYGDLVNGWTSISIFINKCNPQVEKCLNQTYIDNIVANTVVVVSYLSYQINNYNSTTPNILKVETTAMVFSTSILKTYFYYIRQNVYDTDYGFIFQEHQQVSFYTYDSKVLDVSFSLNSLKTSLNFGSLAIINAETVSRYYRTYDKGQAVLANIGGIIKAVMVMAKVIAEFLTRRMSYLDISNVIFELEEEKKDNNRIIERKEKNMADNKFKINKSEDVIMNFSKLEISSKIEERDKTR